MLRPRFEVEGPYLIRVFADTGDALDQILEAYESTWPEPNAAATRLCAALEASCYDDERTMLTDDEAVKVADALDHMGKRGTASELRMAVERCRDADRQQLVGYVAYDGGVPCFFPRRGPTRIPLVGVALVAAERDGARWELPRRRLP